MTQRDSIALSENFRLSAITPIRTGLLPVSLSPRNGFAEESETANHIPSGEPREETLSRPIDLNSRVGKRLLGAAAGRMDRISTIHEG